MFQRLFLYPFIKLKWVVGIYLFGIGILALCFAYYTPPARGVDEIAHFSRSLQVSQGDFLPYQYGHNLLGGPLNERMMHYMVVFMHQPILSHSEVSTLNTQLQQIPKNDKKVAYFSSAASYSPVMYFPSALGITVAKIFHLTIPDQYLAGRIGNLLGSLLLLWLAFLLLPSGRILMLFLFSTPAAIQYFGSYNPDYIANLIVVIFIACCLQLRVEAFEYIKQYKSLILILAVILGLLKLTYCFFTIIIFLIPVSIFKNKQHYFLFCLITIGMSMVTMLVWNLSYPFSPGEAFHTGADPQLAIHTLITQPLSGISHILHNIVHRVWPWWKEVYNAFFGTNLILVIAWGPYIGLVFLLSSLFVEESIITSKIVGNIFIMLAIFYTILVLLAFYISFSTVTSILILGVQGRYFLLPAFLILFAIHQIIPKQWGCKKYVFPLMCLNFLFTSYVVLKASYIVFSG